MGRSAAQSRRLPPSSVRGLLCLVVLLAACGSSPRREVGKAGSQVDFGVQMAQRGLWSEAVFRFERARDEDPRNAGVLNNLAVAYEALGRFDDALAAYRAALEISPDVRAMRQNYTRFLEFYQSFKPKPPAEPAPPAPAAPAPPGQTSAPADPPAGGESGS
jgi:Tfp pilus assembly protein PilF